MLNCPVRRMIINDPMLKEKRNMRHSPEGKEVAQSTAGTDWRSGQTARTWFEKRESRKKRCILGSLYGYNPICKGCEEAEKLEELLVFDSN
jgi:hypothetical protein